MLMSAKTGGAGSGIAGGGSEQPATSRSMINWYLFSCRLICLDVLGLIQMLI
jgi:hypothetical protein